ncbi:hypothetical protein [Kitasatospora sp. NPDC056531]|uniref:hypothetical protein n=1 Tax=Kitasatospora sp. NPDC056531 TaxID=3345856 RepID=UPI0036A3410B
MGGFFAAALAFPTALFSFALVVVVGYWLLMLFGGLGGFGHPEGQEERQTTRGGGPRYL